MCSRSLRNFVLFSTLSMLCILGKADIHDIYIKNGYKNVHLFHIVQFPFVNGLIEYLNVISHDLLVPMLDFVVSSQTDLRDLEDLIYLEEELATTSSVHSEILRWLNKWLFSY